MDIQENDFEHFSPAIFYNGICDSMVDLFKLNPQDPLDDPPAPFISPSSTSVHSVEEDRISNFDCTMVMINLAPLPQPLNLTCPKNTQGKFTNPRGGVKKFLPKVKHRSSGRDKADDGNEEVQPQTPGRRGPTQDPVDRQPDPVAPTSPPSDTPSAAEAQPEKMPENVSMRTIWVGSHGPPRIYWPTAWRRPR